MTNSTPKMNNKVERQVSPNTSAKKRHRGGSTRTTYFSNNNKKYSSPTTLTQTPNGNSGTRFSTSPCSKNYPRSLDSSGYSSSSSSSSPSRSSGNGSPTNSYFAGSKWSDPPSPTALPQPPRHWTPTRCQQSENSLMTNHLKMILNVKA
ncbi:uncharacterized protein LOC141537720 [Cotesia typhae]|uniref:uncharacterized protein LOC141537720 n=1 Tax=Cotesia typhae TaxID=2053667 RepID=UPI003D681001